MVVRNGKGDKITNGEEKQNSLVAKSKCKQGSREQMMIYSKLSPSGTARLLVSGYLGTRKSTIAKWANGNFNFT